MTPHTDSSLSDSLPPSWLVPDWPAIAHVHALCTSRDGGVSQAPWGSMNLGDHVGDVPAHVQRNRELLTAALAAQTPGACATFLQQVHGVDVRLLQARDALEAGPWGAVSGQAFDACVTADAGVACTIMVADCLPVLLAHQSGCAVGAAHAGWRGLAGMPPGRTVQQGPLEHGVLESLFASFCALVQYRLGHGAIKNGGLSAHENSSQHQPCASASLNRAEIASRTQAWLGPCIGAEAFEVGAEVREAFVAHDPQASRHFHPGTHSGKYQADLQALARQRLQALGITQIYGNDGGDDWCTVRNASRFFSHRRDAARLGSSGRLAACIWRDDRG